MIGSLRHAQLSVAGAPSIGESLVRQMPLWIGTLIHDDVHRMLRDSGVPYMAEVNLTPWLPKGWAGTADAVIWNPELKAFVLADFKTTKGESVRYIESGGAKAEHIAQTSAYWHALRRMGLPLAKVVGVYYLPKNDTRSKSDVVEPVMVEFEPTPARQLERDMKDRWGRISSYVASVGGEPGVKEKPPPPKPDITEWLTDELEPVQPRQQRVYFDRSTATYELKLVPHWSADFCSFPHELCDCGAQGSTKLGIFDQGGDYFPRSGYEDVEPEVEPPARYIQEV